jgi:putative two-component system response regulator
MAAKITLYHHERWDGKGYPEGLSGENIPLSARIVALVDVYDALTSKRAYKESLPHEQAIEIIKKEKNKHFDPEVTDVFIELEQKIKELRMKLR